MSRKPYLEVGYVARAHGLHGEFAVRTFDPASETLFEVERLLVRPRSGPERILRLASARPTPKEVLVSIEEISSRTEAEALVGSTVLAFREDLEPPAEGEFFLGDLIGLTAVDESGQVLGTVEEVQGTGEVPNLVIRGPQRPELLVPFVDDFVPTVDLQAGRTVIRLPEYTE